jgi:hypothetical protein
MLTKYGATLMTTEERLALLDRPVTVDEVMAFIKDSLTADEVQEIVHNATVELMDYMEVGQYIENAMTKVLTIEETAALVNEKIKNNRSSNGVIEVGGLLALALSIKLNGLTWWAIPHTIVGWLYVFYMAYTTSPGY